MGPEASGGRAMDVGSRVKAILAEQALLDPADVGWDMTLRDLDIDSLGLVEAIFAIEEAFGVTVPFNANTPEASGFDASTVATIAAAVEGLVAGRP